MKKEKPSKQSNPVKRCGVLDRETVKKDGKIAMDALWTIASHARADLSVTEYEVDNYEVSLRVVEQELHSLTLPPGTKASLPDEIG